ncbi:hypothetical protein [Actimicrobium antarcticum]|uniref:Uncharacterized protein n=1 Tax=Actimicrobium antarcticum TaxID=1051899 RepID=A0ABP7U1T4_9BURK
MKYRHYGVVVVVVVLGVAVLWQITREAAVIAPRPVPGQAQRALPLPPPVNSPVARAVPPLVVGAASEARERTAVVAGTDSTTPPAVQRQVQRDPDLRLKSEQEARRKADDDSRNQKAESARSEEADLRARQEELLQQAKAAAAMDSRTPQQLCADRSNFFSRAICEARECEKPERATLPFCVDMQERRAPKDFTN